MSERPKIKVSVPMNSLLRSATAAAARAVLDVPSTAEQAVAINVLEAGMAVAIEAAVAAALEESATVLQPYLDAIDAGVATASLTICDGSVLTITKGLITNIAAPPPP